MKVDLRQACELTGIPHFRESSLRRNSNIPTIAPLCRSKEAAKFDLKAARTTLESNPMAHGIL